MKLFYAFLALTSLSLSVPALAQTSSQAPAAAAPQPQAGRLSGRLVDAQNQPVPYATVTLMRADSSIVNGDLTKENGSFNIQPTGLGRFILRVQALGFKPYFAAGIGITGAEPERDLGRIVMAASSTALEEVQVVGERPIMEMSVDKKVFNVEKNTTTAGGSAADVLQNVPSVSVDAEGNVSLRGKGEVTILIDGKPATLLGSDAASALQSLPAASIQSVEVITNPSARYDASGATGIINIVTKKDARFGTNGSITAGVGTRDKYNGNISLNMRNDRWNLFANSSFRLNRNESFNTIDRRSAFTDTFFHTREESLREHLGWFSTLGAEYAISERTSLGLTQNINVMRFGNEGISDYGTYVPGQGRIRNQQRESEFSVSPFNLSSSLDFKHKFRTPRQELTANVTFANMNASRSQRYVTRNYDIADSVPPLPTLQQMPGSGSNRSLNSQVDFTTPMLTKNGRFDAGLKSQMFDFESQGNPTITQPGQAERIDSNQVNNYNYEQDIYAAYANFNDQQGKWSYQAGLRMEYATYRGTTSRVGNQVYTNEFLNLFPSAFVSYQIAPTQTAYLSYSRRINRPSFWNLMPFLDISNPQDTSTGNPGLKPELIHNTEFNYSKTFKRGHNLIFSAYYQYTEDMIERIRTPYADGTTMSRPENLNFGTTYGLEVTGRLLLTKIWDATVSLNGFQNRIEGLNVSPDLNNEGFGWFGKLNTNVRLPQNFSLQMNANYEGPKVAGQGTREEVYWFDVALRKNLWNNKATLVLNVSDILNTRKYTTRYDFGNSWQTMYRDRETRIGNLTFTYRFGKNESNNNRRRSQQAPARERDNLRGDDDGGGQGGF